jgi:hypothetical protein
MEGRWDPAAFRSMILKTFDRQGFWRTSGEFAMGGDIWVRLDRLKENSGDVVYRATAEYGIKISADYKSLDRAIGMLRVFAALVWDMASQSDACQDLQFHQPE